MRGFGQAKLGISGSWLMLLVALAAAGCTSTVEGKPTAGSDADAAQPSVSPPRSRAPSAPSVPGPSGAIALPPNDNGYVFIETKSGRTRCQISSEQVGCEAEFANSPIKDGEHANGVSITPDGTVAWVLGNLGDIPVVTIDYRTYTAEGWTIAAGVDGTRFTNNHTGHGIFVSIDDVETF